MSVHIPAFTLEKFTNFGDLLRYLRRRAGLTQMELSIAVGYSDAQISRLEQNLRLPDIPTIEARFVPSLGIQGDAAVAARLLDLAARVRRQDAPALGHCPYKGLNYFDDADADIFVGREALTETLIDRVLSLATSEVRFLAVVGASGSGKSSLVRAGVVPALRWIRQSMEWQVQIFTPTAHPLESLAASLTQENNSVLATATLMDDLARDPRSLQIHAKQVLAVGNNACLLLVVDQFEELFALCRSEQERASFIECLLTAALETDGPVSVVITLRADFYTHCANYARLREALARQQEYIGAMNADEMRRAIEEPARRGQWEFEPGLVDLLLHDVGQEPGALPLLSHALYETWQRRRGRVMTMSGYVSSGGVHGAIAETAETVFADQFTREQKLIARRIFLRMTELGEEHSMTDTRRRVKFDELILKPEDTEKTRAVLKSLADARLITTSEAWAEVAHEALIREWPTLRGWLDENRESLKLQRQLTEAAREWLGMGRSVDVLYRGARLAHAREWAGAHDEEINVAEREFLAASIEASEREAAEREAQRQRELQAAKKLAETQKARAEEQAQSAQRLRLRNRVISTVGAIALILAVLAGVFGSRSNQNARVAQENAATAQIARDNALSAQAAAETERLRAENETRLTISRELALAANASLEVDPERSVLLALLSLSQVRTIEAESALHAAVQQASRVQLSLDLGNEVRSVAYNPDGTRLAAVSGDATVKVWDAATGRELLSFVTPEKPNWIRFSADGARLGIAYGENKAGIWDASTAEELLSLSGHAGVVYIAFSPDGKRVATVSVNSNVKFWDSHTGQELLTLDTHQNGINSVAFSPDGTRLVTGGWDTTARVWDVASGIELLRLAGHATRVDAAFSPDGSRIVTVSVDAAAKVWDANSGEELYTLSGLSVSGVPVFSPDGTRLVKALNDGRIIVWDLATGEELLTYPVHVGFITDVAMHPDSIHLAASSRNGTIKILDISPQGSREWFTVVTDPIKMLAKVVYNPDGTLLATLGLDNTVAIWDAFTGEQRAVMAGHTAPIWDIAFHPDGSRLATGSADMTVRIWDTYSGMELHQFSQAGHGDGLIGGLFRGIMGIAFSPDGKLLASAGADGTAILWDVATGKAVKTFSHRGIGITNVAFNPRGTHLVTAGGDSNSILDVNSTTRVWDLSNGKELFTVLIPGRAWGLAFNPDGSRLVVSGFAGVVKVWDAMNGQELVSLFGHTGTVLDVAFSPDGTTIATASGDETVKLWDVNTGDELLTLSGHAGFVSGVAFSPDGMRLATTSFDGTARVYLLKIEELIALAKSRLTRGLTIEECQKYLHQDTCPEE